MASAFVLSFEHDGLNLTRATLNALRKYPWLHEVKDDRSEKWGSYHSERDVVGWRDAKTLPRLTRFVAASEPQLT